jgi:hypothetical protein
MARDMAPVHPVVQARACVLVVVSLAFDAALGGAGVEQIRFAESAYSGDCRPALFERDEAAIAAAAASPAAILRAPRVGICLAGRWHEHGQRSQGEKKQPKSAHRTPPGHAFCEQNVYPASIVAALPRRLGGPLAGASVEQVASMRRNFDRDPYSIDKIATESSAADLKFLHRLQQARSGTSNR